MSNHQKRLSVPDSWPVERKTATFTVAAEAGPHGEDGVPLLIVLRDVLGYANNRKEARYALDQDQVLINGTPVSDESRPVGMFDILAFSEREEYYRVFPGEGGRLALTEIDADAAQSKLGKIVGKRNVSGGDVQLTLHDGHTLLVADGDPYSGGDSIVVANEVSEASSDASNASGDGPRADEIVAHFAYEEGALVTAVDGQHAGKIGTIEAIQITPGSSPNNVIVDQDGEGFETIEEYVVVIDENFTFDDGADADEDAETDVEDGADAETDVEDGADAETAVEDDADAETDVEDGADAETDVEDGADAETDVEDDADAETDVEDDTDAETDVEDGADAETVIEDDADAETDVDADAQADADVESAETSEDGGEDE